MEIVWGKLSNYQRKAKDWPAPCETRWGMCQSGQLLLSADVDAAARQAAP